MRKKRQYTEMGRRIAGLAKNQSELAEVLGLTQQSVSGKLRGTIAITLTDIMTLAANYHVPQMFFFMPEHVTVDQTRDVLKLVMKDYVNLEMARKGLRTYPVQFWQMVADEWKKGVPVSVTPGHVIRELARYEELQQG